MRFLSLLALAASAAYASPAEKRQAAAPSAVIRNGTVVGSSSGGIDSFKGIPFALPPTGTRRLMAPSSITSTFGTITATGTPTACPQFYVPVSTSNLPEAAVGLLLDTPFGQQAQTSGEDCLTVNVQRPSGTNSSSELPVVFWIFGGGFEFGSTQTYDASQFIAKSVSLGEPVLYVSTNYRVGGFGFLAGSDLAKEGNTNLGLRDQRLAMQWAQDNVAAFGGDPTKVTIWGESAGSISVFDHTIINNGDNSYNGGSLFRGAIMDSGSVIPALNVSSKPAQTVYNTVVQNAGCSASANKLACLRALPYTKFLNAVNSVPSIFSYQSLDLSYLPRPDPGNAFFSESPELPLQSGRFTKVPVIIGDQEDEGTLFSLVLSNVTTTSTLVAYLQSYFSQATQTQLQGLVNTYPTDPSAGSPFNTGLLNELYPQFKRNAALLGDITFTLSRRTYLSLVSPSVKSWSYLASYFYGTPVLGTFHATDILEVYFGAEPTPTNTIRTYYISFINYLDPNVISTASPLVPWPQWTAASPQLVNFKLLANTIIPDNFRQASYQYLVTLIPFLHV